MTLKALSDWLSYEWAGLIASIIVLALTYSCLKNNQPPNWPLLFIFTGFLAYHMGRKMFERYIDMLERVTPK